MLNAEIPSTINSQKKLDIHVSKMYVIESADNALPATVFVTMCVIIHVHVHSVCACKYENSIIY